MKYIILCILTLILLGGCNNSKWETIKGIGINDEPKSISEVIYFENENNGLVGGYTLVEDKNANTADGLVLVPTLFLTEDGGKYWKKIKFNPILRTSVHNAYLHDDTLICQLDSTILFSIDKGKMFQTINDSLERNKIIDRYFKTDRYEIKDHNFLFKNKKYYIKEQYQNQLAIVIVCYGEGALTDYYFVSFDKGNTWQFLQDSYGDNKARYLFEDKFLYSYEYLFGLQRLKLK